MRSHLRVLIMMCLGLLPVGELSAGDYRGDRRDYTTVCIGLGTIGTAGGSQVGPSLGIGVDLRLSRSAFVGFDMDASRFHIYERTRMAFAADFMLKLNLSDVRSHVLLLPGVGIGIGVLPNAYMANSQTNLTFRGTWQMYFLKDSRSSGGVFEMGILTAPGRQRGQGFTMPFFRMGFMG